MNIREEVAGLNKHYFDSLSTLGGSHKDSLIHIIFPVILPRIFSSLRLNLGTAIAVLFLTETFATRRGIGWYIMDAWSRFEYRQMYAGIPALSIAGLFLFGLQDAGLKRLCRWKEY